MDLLDYRFYGFKYLGMLIDPFPADYADKGDKARYEKADIIVLSVAVELLYPLYKSGLGLPLDHIGAFHGKHDDTILDLYASDFPRAKERFKLRIHIPS